MASRRVFLLLGLLATAAALAWNRVSLEAPSAPTTASDIPPTAGSPPVAKPLNLASLAREHYPSRISDTASALGIFEPKLVWLADAWMEDLGVDFHVVTVDAPNTSIEDLATGIFEVRRIGADAPTGGILLVMNPARQEARIEVSYSLEPAFPDALIGRIATDQLAPYVSYAAGGMAVMDVLHNLKDYAYLRAAQGALDLDERYRDRDGYLEKVRYLSGGGGAFAALSDLPIDRDLKARVPDDRRARYAPSNDPLRSVEALLRVQRELVGDPTLDLYTAGTRVLLQRYPFAPFEELERMSRVEASKPLSVIVEGDRAVATSDHPAHGFVPVLLRRVDGTWRVDHVETWKNLFFSRTGDYFLANSNTPYAFGLSDYGEGPYVEIGAYELDGADPAELLAELAAREGALVRFLEAEILFRNCWVTLEALKKYEEAIALAPHSLVFKSTLGDRAMYLGFPELAVSAYQKMGKWAPLELARAHARAGDVDAAIAFLEKRIERNPYDAPATRMLKDLYERSGDGRDARKAAASLEAMSRDTEMKHAPLEMRFEPTRPVLHTEEPIFLEGRALYDHSSFGVKIINRSNRPVDVQSVVTTSAGTGQTSGLGEMVDRWSYPSDGHRLGPGESAHLERSWGFIQDTEHEQLSYVFDYCWRGVGSDVSQCATGRVDLFPR